MIKPGNTLLLLTYVCVLMILLVFLPNKVVFFDLTIKIPKITALFEPHKKVEYADISAIRDKFEVGKAKTKSTSKNKTDFTQKNKKHKTYIPDSLRLNPELLIQYPEGKDTLLFGFFRSLRSLETRKTHIRAVHYGDSQLEGDRITAFLREKFQQQFGGCGVGIANVEDKLGSKTSIAQSTSPNWTKYMAYGPGFRQANSNYYGILGDYYKFIEPQEPKWTKATLSYIKSPVANSKQKLVENIKVLYRNPHNTTELIIQATGEEEVKTTLESSEQFQIFEHKLQNAFEQVSIHVASGGKSPELYGVALDCNMGITFDNVPLRGSSGVDFSRMNATHLKKQFEKLNVKFLILQFGVNVVPSPSQDYGWYEEMFYNQLKFLKSLTPNLSILVVGVSDMSRNVSGVYESYPNIEKIRNAQRNAAFRANCAFWDLYEAMGGKNSMPSWVFAKPEPLASRDFTHFTGKGAAIVAEMLYKALLTEYDKYNELYY
jgi:hypothetical protein